MIGQSGLGNAKVEKEQEEKEVKEEEKVEKEVEKVEEEEEEVEREKEEAEVVVLVGLKASTKQPRLKHPSSLDMRNEEAIT